MLQKVESKLNVSPLASLKPTPELEATVDPLKVHVKETVEQLSSIDGAMSLTTASHDDNAVNTLVSDGQIIVGLIVS